ncbi:DUF3396 domain-containing protein [Mesorhizobium sp. B2-6-1]|nr:DUF3396 domain-containing protein [Mesorhizobium sp. B2-6-1]
MAGLWRWLKLYTIRSKSILAWSHPARSRWPRLRRSPEDDPSQQRNLQMIDQNPSSRLDYVISRTSIRMIFYVSASHQEIKFAIEAAIRSYVQLVSLSSFGYYFNVEGDPEPVNRTSFEAFSDLWFHGSLGDYPNATMILQGHDPDYPGYGIEYWGRELMQDSGEVSFLCFWLPFSTFGQKPEAFVSFFKDVVNRLPVSSAYMSPAFVSGTQREKQAVANRFRGIDIANPEVVAIELAHDSPGVYWLNYLSFESHSGELNFDAVPSDGTAPLSVSEGPRYGIYFQIGDAPSLIDQNARDPYSIYSFVASKLDSLGILHSPEKVVYFMDGQGAGDPELQRAWHRRFLT